MTSPRSPHIVRRTHDGPCVPISARLFTVATGTAGKPQLGPSKVFQTWRVHIQKGHSNADVRNHWIGPGVGSMGRIWHFLMG